MLKPSNGRWLIITLVILSYAIFSLPNIILNGFTKTPQSFYHSLTEGFLSGQLSMTVKPLPQLLKLPNPYDPNMNQSTRLGDASLYHGKYYLYFGPLPILTFFMPFKVLTGLYPPQGLAILFFSALGFLVNFLVLIKIKQKYFPSISEFQLNFIGLLVGFGNNLLYVYLLPNFYEVAIISAYCFMSLAVYFLFDVLSNNSKVRTVAAFATCLALSVAGRPSFVLVTLLLVPVTAFFLIKNAPKKQLHQLLLALLLPVISIGFALALYNYLRFGSIFEYGLSYQLGNHDYRYYRLINADFYKTFFLQFYYYFIQPILLHSINPVPQLLWPLVGATTYEVTVGVLTTTPIIFMVLILPKLWVIDARNKNYLPQPVLWFSTCVALIALVMLGLLLSVRFVAERYEIDFLPYLITAAVINIWLLQEYVSCPRLLMKIAKLFFMVTSTLSILIGVNFGLLAYHFSIDVVLLSVMTSILFLLIPCGMLLTYLMIRCMDIKNCSPSVAQRNAGNSLVPQLLSALDPK